MTLKLLRPTHSSLCLPALVLIVVFGMLAAGCMAGVVVDDTTGHGVPGATVRYTDSQGTIHRVLADSAGVYRFDRVAGVAPAAGPITIEVRARGYQTLTTTRVVDYRDNPGATLSDLSSFWEIQNFRLKPLAATTGADLEAFDTMWLPPYHGSGELQLWVRNNGPDDVTGVSGRIDCTVEQTDVATGNRDALLAAAKDGADQPDCRRCDDVPHGGLYSHEHVVVRGLLHDYGRDERPRPAEQHVHRADPGGRLNTRLWARAARLTAVYATGATAGIALCAIDGARRRFFRRRAGRSMRRYEASASARVTGTAMAAWIGHGTSSSQ